MKFVKVREFKGKTYIDIREYYTDKKTMDMMPGKKGISLNCEQYQKLKSIISEVDRALPWTLTAPCSFIVTSEVLYVPKIKLKYSVLKKK